MSGLKQGQRFGMLRVTRIDTVGKVTCVCDCGGACVVHVKELRSGACVSCGCKPAPTKAFTAAQIEKGKLDELGKRVEAHLQKMRAYEAEAQKKAGVELRKADNHWNTVTQLLADAKAQCDRGGFNMFQKMYAPDLGRSRIYELLAIGTGKKTVEEARAEPLKRVQKHRAKASVTAPVTNSAGVDVTPPSEPDGPPPEPGKPVATEDIFKRRIGVGVKAPVDEALQQLLLKKMEDYGKQPKPTVTDGSAEPKQTEPEAASAPPVTPPPAPAKPPGAIAAPVADSKNPLVAFNSGQIVDFLEALPKAKLNAVMHDLVKETKQLSIEQHFAALIELLVKEDPDAVQSHLNKFQRALNAAHKARGKPRNADQQLQRDVLDQVAADMAGATNSLGKRS